MTEKPSSPDGRPPADYDVDPSVMRPARLYNYLAGGDGNFSVDRAAAEHVASGLAGGLDTIRTAVQAVGHFTQRVVRYLVEEAGIRQLLNIGTPVPGGGPGGGEVHQVAQALAPDVRVVYVGNDPVVLAHAHTLQRGTPEGATTYVQGTLRDPDAIWEQATRTLDPSRPVGILIPVTLCLVPEVANPHGILSRLLDATAPGSSLMLAHVTGDIPTECSVDGPPAASDRLREALPEQYVIRSRDEVARFFADLRLVEPGLVPIADWRPSPDTPSLTMPMYGAVGQKP